MLEGVKMKEKLFAKFCKTGKIVDYLKYREEIARELVEDERNQKKKRDNSSYDGLSRKS